MGWRLVTCLQHLDRTLAAGRRRLCRHGARHGRATGPIRGVLFRLAMFVEDVETDLSGANVFVAGDTGRIQGGGTTGLLPLAA